jgi:predicted naringenin-chalcone synthase
MRIASAASAFPKHYYSQKVLLQRLQDYWGEELKNPLLLARLHRNVTVDGRYLAVPAEEYVDIKRGARRMTSGSGWLRNWENRHCVSRCTTLV